MKVRKAKKYTSPDITVIELDNEISLQLASDATPSGEPDDWSKAPAHPTDNPYGWA